MNASETWTTKAGVLEGKFPQEETTLEKSKYESLRKSFESVKKAMNPNIEKVTEVKEKLENIQKAFGRLEWITDCTAYLQNDTERKKLEDLESLFHRAEECKVPRTWTMFSNLETLYTQVKDLVLKAKKLMADSQNKMEIEETIASGTVEILDYEKKSEAMEAKITNEELEQTLTKMKQLSTRVDFDQAIEFLENSKKNQEKYT